MNKPEEKDGWMVVAAYRMHCSNKKKYVWHNLLILDIDEEIKKKIFPVVCIFKLKCTKCDDDETICIGCDDGTSTYRKNAKITKEMLEMPMYKLWEMVNK